MKFRSVQFKMVYMCSEKPTCAPPRLSEVSPTLSFTALTMVPMLCDWRWPSLVLWRKIVKAEASVHASPPGDRWCDVLGFVPACSVSSSSALQIFRETSHLWGLLFPPVYLLGHFPSLRHVCSQFMQTAHCQTIKKQFMQTPHCQTVKIQFMQTPHCQTVKIQFMQTPHCQTVKIQFMQTPHCQTVKIQFMQTPSCQTIKIQFMQIPHCHTIYADTVLPDSLCRHRTAWQFM